MTESTIGLEDGHIVCRVNGVIEFQDSAEHWKDGVLRLLEREESDVSRFIKDACMQIVEEDASGEAVIQILKRSWSSRTNLPEAIAKPKQPSWLHSDANNSTWLTDSVRDTTEFGIALSLECNHAWLAHRESGVPAGLDSVFYELEYFEGGQQGIGYGSYANQAEWRMEKAHRQCREVSAIMKFVGIDNNKSRVLDIGSGYGYFRKACADAGWLTQGVEISKYACRVANEMYGLETYCGSLEAFSETCGDRFDAIVMWDFIEHVEDPIANLVIAQRLLTNGGLLFIRTPNLDAIEFEVFGSAYHSLKREHLNLFSALSLSRCMTDSGLMPVMTLSESHLLSGFVRSEVPTWATTLRGSDLLSVGRSFYK